MLSQPTRIEVPVLVIFGIYFRISGNACSMGGDVPVDHEKSVASSSISR